MEESEKARLDYWYDKLDFERYLKSCVNMQNLPLTCCDWSCLTGGVTRSAFGAKPVPRCEAYPSLHGLAGGGSVESVVVFLFCRGAFRMVRHRLVVLVCFGDLEQLFQAQTRMSGGNHLIAILSESLPLARVP